MKVLGFSIESYSRYGVNGKVEEDCGYKNIVPLEDMTPQQRYETALADDIDVLIWDNVDALFQDMNDELVSTNDMWFYTYNG